MLFLVAELCMISENYLNVSAERLSRNCRTFFRQGSSFKSRSSVRFTRVCTPGSSRSHAIEVVESLRKLSSSDQPIDKLANTRLPAEVAAGEPWERPATVRKFDFKKRQVR